jgi:hypothetical protein
VVMAAVAVVAVVMAAAAMTTAAVMTRSRLRPRGPRLLWAGVAVLRPFPVAVDAVALRLPFLVVAAAVVRPAAHRVVVALPLPQVVLLAAARRVAVAVLPWQPAADGMRATPPRPAMRAFLTFSSL